MAHNIQSEMKAIRSGLQCSTVEAIFATIHLVLSQGIFLTNYVLDLGATNFVCGIVESLPFLTQFFAFISPFLVRRMQSRKPVTVAFSIAHRAAWVVLIALLFIEWPVKIKITLMVLTLLLSNACAVIAGNAWFSWMTDLVPTAIRGSYYGRRNAYLGLASLITLFIGSQFLSLMRATGWGRAGYATCFSVAVISACFAAFMLSRQYEPPLRPVPPMTPKQMLRILRERPMLRIFIRFYVIWQFSLGLAAAFFGVHMVKVLHMSPALMGYHALIASTMAWVGSQVWGKAIDRVGERAVLLTSGLFIVICVWVYLPAYEGFLFPIWSNAFIAGFCWAGFNICVFSWPQRLCGKEDRQYAFGMVGLFSGPAFVTGSLLGGTLTTVLPEVLFTIGGFKVLHFHLLFFLSSIGRLSSVLLIANWSSAHDQTTRSVTRCVTDTVRELYAATLEQSWTVRLIKSHSNSRDQDRD